MKQVGMITAKQFGYVFIGGVPYSPAKVKRFMAKGLGIKLQDLVIFDFDLVENTRVLSYLKNAKYADGSELAMVKEFVRASELKMAEMRTGELSEEIKKELAEEGVTITNDGDVVSLSDEQIKELKKVVGETAPEEVPAFEPPMELDPELLKLLLPDQRRQLSIILQSSLKAAAELNISNCVFADAIMIAKWVDRNSTQILVSAQAYVDAREEGK